MASERFRAQINGDAVDGYWVHIAENLGGHWYASRDIRPQRCGTKRGAEWTARRLLRRALRKDNTRVDKTVSAVDRG